MSQDVLTYVEIDVPSPSSSGFQIIQFLAGSGGSPIWYCGAPTGLDPDTLYGMTVRVDNIPRFVYIPGQFGTTFITLAGRIYLELLSYATVSCEGSLNQGSPKFGGSPLIGGLIIESVSSGPGSQIQITDGAPFAESLLANISFPSTVLTSVYPITTYRFTYADEVILFDSLPTLEGVSITPAKISPGQSIGQRESVSVDFGDFLYQFDTEPFTAGTFWTKFRARHPQLQGAEMRVYQGSTDDTSLDDMAQRTYIIDDFQVGKQKANIKGKDPLVLLNSDAAQAPRATTGELATALTTTDTTVTLTPTGAGDEDYPLSGKVCLSGSEICTFTRTNSIGSPFTSPLNYGSPIGGDVLFLTTRGENKDAQAHEELASVQQVLVYENQTPSAIVYDLLTSYAAVRPEWITLQDWQDEVDGYIDRNYSAIIPAPVAVKTLLDELCEQIGLVIWWDSLAQQIRLKPLLPVFTAKIADEDSIMKDSFTSKEQPNKRVSQSWLYYGQRDETKPLDEQENYRRVAIKIADNAQDYTLPKIRKIYSRWIPFAARTTADRTNELIIARYSIPPREFSFDLFRSPSVDLPKLGEGRNIEHWFLVDGDGGRLCLPSQVISRTQMDDKSSYVLEEMNFDPPSSIGGSPQGEVRYVYLDADDYNVDLRDYYDSIYSSVAASYYVTFIISSSATIGSVSAQSPAIDVGDWSDVAGINLTLINNGYCVGKGGDGGWAAAAATSAPHHGVDGQSGIDGEYGSTALYTRTAIAVTNNSAAVIGGGGGGGGAKFTSIINVYTSAGGGGAGYAVGVGGSNVSGKVGTDGTLTTGGVGFSGGGTGGTLGVVGDSPSGSGSGNGGAAGDAIDGISYITLTNTGTINGSQVN